ncbi:MAG: SUMF1/EgtB/PvdO family nonheme iron enzyme [Polyangiaceae bacterium]
MKPAGDSAPRPSNRPAPPARRTILLAGGALAVAAALVAGVVLRGLGDSGEPARCAEGLVAMGARCCGAGQRMESGRCIGVPSGCGARHEVSPGGCVPRAGGERRDIAGGHLVLGPGDWEALGVVTRYEADVAAFQLDAFEVTEARWEACLRAHACSQDVPLSGEPGRPVASVTFDEAEGFCRFAGGRLPSRDELVLAISRGGRRYPWGDTGAVCRRAAWGLASGPCASGGSGPDTAGAHPDGASPDGVEDLAGNVAEWARAPAGDAAQGVQLALGGAWNDTEAAALRGWNRRALRHDARDPAVGFRCLYPRE